MAPKSELMVYLGIAPDNDKNFLFMHHPNNIKFISLQALFDEQLFPFCNKPIHTCIKAPAIEDDEVDLDIPALNDHDDNLPSAAAPPFNPPQSPHPCTPEHAAHPLSPPRRPHKAAPECCPPVGIPAVPPALFAALGVNTMCLINLEMFMVMIIIQSISLRTLRETKLLYLLEVGFQDLSLILHPLMLHLLTFQYLT